MSASGRPEDAGAVRRVLVIVTRQLGDVLLTTPLIRRARQRWPEAALHVLGFQGTLGLLKGNADIDALIEVPAGAGWRASWPIIRRLWRRYDLALIGQPSDRAHLYGLVAARRRSGLVTWRWSKSWWQRALLDHAVVVPAERSHVVLEKLALMDPWWPVAMASSPPVRSADAPSMTALVPPGPSALPVALLASLPRRYVVVQVPSLVAYKQWPLAHYAALVRALIDDGLPVVLTGGPGAADRDKVAEVQSALASPAPMVINVAGQLDLNQVTTLLGGACAYIGPDTSITHLAAACGVPVVALYGPVDPRIFGPWPAGAAAVQPWQRRADRQQVGRVVVLQGPQPCVPCNGAGCEGHNASRSDCLVAIAPDRVLAEVRAVLSAAPAGGI